MKLSPEQKSQYRRDIRELTEKLNTEMLELKEDLEWNLVIEEIAYLLHYTVNDKTGTGYVITYAKNVYCFEINSGIDNDDSSIMLQECEDIAEIEENCPQVHVALELVDELYGRYVN